MEAYRGSHRGKVAGIDGLETAMEGNGSDQQRAGGAWGTGPGLGTRRSRCYKCT